jgi:hypothetical protein
MIVIHNSDGSVCCRTSDENNLCNRCRDKYREEDQDMLRMPVMNFGEGNPVSYVGRGDFLPAQTDHDDGILRTPLAGDIFELNRQRMQQQEPKRQSDFITNDSVDPDMLITPTLAY